MRAASRDANEPEVIKALVAVGCLVQQITQGDGVPDLIVCTPRGRLLLIEVKDGAKPPSGRKFKPAQVTWHAIWAPRAPVFVCLSPADALAAVAQVDAAA